MIILKDHKALFLGTPKAGCHSINAALSNNFGGVHVTYEFLGLNHGRVHPFHVNVVPEAYRKFFKFSCVRNPFSRAVSIWWHVMTVQPAKGIFRAMVGGESFKSFAKWIYQFNRDHGRCFCWEVVIPQVVWLENVKLDRVLKLEQLQPDFQHLPFVNRKVPIKKLNSRDRERTIPWWDYYSDRDTTKYIVEWAKEDFTRFGYAKTVPNRKQRKKMGLEE